MSNAATASTRGIPLIFKDGRVVCKVPRVLIADDEANIRLACRDLLEAEGVHCDEAEDGLSALEAASTGMYAVVILDVDMPGMRGSEVCRRIREKDLESTLKIILVSGRATPDEMARMLSAGADDYLGKPFGGVQLQERVKLALRLKGRQDESDRLNRELREMIGTLGRSVRTHHFDLVQARATFVRGLAKLAECRDGDTGAHLERLRHFSICLAEGLADHPDEDDAQIGPDFIELLGCCAPLHDIGKVGLPDRVLSKPGSLDPDERLVMQSHTVIGYDALRSLVDQNGFALDLLAMGMAIARHHHERFDGQGYPDRLSGKSIPLAARIVTVCDVYDALRSRRVYKPSMPHDAVVKAMVSSPGGAFDPHLLDVFQQRAEQFDRIFLAHQSDGPL